MRNQNEAYLESEIDSETRRFPLGAGRICYIGRSPHNTIVLEDSQVSSHHAMLQGELDAGFYLSDLSSRNGTFVNGRRVTAPVQLRPGDRITLGQQQLCFHGPLSREWRATRGATAAIFAQRVITVLVADIRGFTGLAACLGATRISELICAFTRDAGKILEAQDAWTHKFIGDAVMAMWLHQDQQPALPEMRRVIEALSGLFEMTANLTAHFQLDAPIRIGAGLNTGVACVGNMGSEASADYTALSDAVNLAFRLESATKEIGCDVALGRGTYEFLAGHLPASGGLALHKLMLKGYREPQPVYAATRSVLQELLEAFPRCVAAT